MRYVGRQWWLPFCLTLSVTAWIGCKDKRERGSVSLNQIIKTVKTAVAIKRFSRQSTERLHSTLICNDLEVPFVATEIKKMLLFQDFHSFRDSNKVKKKISCQCQDRLHKITQECQTLWDYQQCGISPSNIWIAWFPPAWRNTKAADHKDVWKHHIIVSVAVSSFILIGTLLTSVVTSLMEKRKLSVDSMHIILY